MGQSVTESDIDLPALAYAIAKNDCGEKLPLADVLLREGISTQTPGLRALLTSDLFKSRYIGYLDELKKSGESFRLKARVQAEELLATQWTIIHDPDAPASVRMKGIENVVAWAGLEAKKEKAEQQQAPAITINIDLGGERPETIDVTPQPALIEGAAT